MNKNKKYLEYEEEEAKWREELEKNPLLKYSTTQLKREIRRRKRGKE